MNQCKFTHMSHLTSKRTRNFDPKKPRKNIFQLFLKLRFVVNQ